MGVGGWETCEVGGWLGDRTERALTAFLDMRCAYLGGRVGA
jgi:hypothetical protein